MTTHVGPRAARLCAAVVLSVLLQGRNAGSAPSGAETGRLTLHLLLHAIGEESYEVKPGEGDGLVMNTSFEYSDRGRKRTLTAVLRMKRDFSPESYELSRQNSTSITRDSVDIGAGTATVHEDAGDRKIELPGQYFVGFGSSPFSVQMMMMRYWASHGKPARLPILRANPGAQDARIQRAGRDSLVIDGKAVPLTRYTVANIVFGREVLWLNAQEQLAAVMTFAGGLPFEAVRQEYEPALAQLVRSGVAEEMRTLADLQRQVPPAAAGSFALAGATLVDGTGRPPVPDSVVLVRQGRIAAAGPRSQVAIPPHIKIVDAAGQTLLPGLWEMHTHFSGVEFGPALLAAGITTARDCGGEFEFLTTERDEIEQRHGLGPRLLLAGLVDAGGLGGFGAVTADTPDEARAVVAKYAAAGFQQIKLYTLLKPEVITALAAEAHRRGMTVTGHVPAALDALQGVEAGMDQINHLNFVSQVMRAPRSESGNEAPGEARPIDIHDAQSRKVIQFLRGHNTVVDPTVSWGEMAGRSRDIEISSFEPGIDKAPYTVASKFLGLGSPATESARFHARMSESLAVIGALRQAGIPIVAGSDTGLIGYGLDRELELYVAAGMTPLEAIQAATIVPARAMKLADESGSIEPGKRADLILVDGNPLQNIGDIRKVSRVVAHGRMYNAAQLWKSIGFLP